MENDAIEKNHLQKILEDDFQRSLKKTPNLPVKKNKDPLDDLYDRMPAKKNGDDLDGLYDRAHGIQEETPGRTFSGTAKDLGIAVAKGFMAVPESAVGLLDIPTAGHVGKFVDETLGFDFKKAGENADAMMSPAQKAAKKRVSDANGFWGKTGKIITNPSTVIEAVVESLPLMVAGGAVGKIAGKGFKLAPWVAGAVGEGVAAAGSAAEQIRQQTDNKLLSAKQSLYAAGSGVGTGAFGMVGGRLAKKFGFADADTMMVEIGSEISEKGVIRRIIEGGVSEGLLEELPQSVQEQVWQNAALNRPLSEGVDEAAAMGLLTGAAMGATVNALDTKIKNLKQFKKPSPDQKQRIHDLEKKKTEAEGKRDQAETENQYWKKQEQEILTQQGKEQFKHGIKDQETLPQTDTRGNPRYADVNPFDYEDGKGPVPARDVKRETFIDNLIKKVGSLEAVEELYPDNDSESQYVKAKAKKFYAPPATHNQGEVEQQAGIETFKREKAAQALQKHQDSRRGIDQSIPFQNALETRPDESKIPTMPADMPKSQRGMQDYNDGGKYLPFADLDKGKLKPQPQSVPNNPVYYDDGINVSDAKFESESVHDQRKFQNGMTNTPGGNQDVPGANIDGRMKPVFDSKSETVLQDSPVPEHEVEPDKVNTDPSDAQKEAGNYKKSHIKIDGLNISIENPDGSTRKGKDKLGKEWESTMTGHYGYFNRTMGKDGDQVDVVVKAGTETSPKIFVVDQVDPETGRFDEHKVVMGTEFEQEAKDLYMSNYEKGWGGFGAITEMGQDDFKAWLKDGKRTKKPLAVSPDNSKTGNSFSGSNNSQNGSQNITETSDKNSYPDTDKRTEKTGDSTDFGKNDITTFEDGQGVSWKTKKGKPMTGKILGKHKSLGYRVQVDGGKKTIVSGKDLTASSPGALSADSVKSDEKTPKIVESGESKESEVETRFKNVGKNSDGKVLYIDKDVPWVRKIDHSSGHSSTSPQRYKTPKALYDAGEDEFLTAEELEGFTRPLVEKKPDHGSTPKQGAESKTDKIPKGFDPANLLAEFDKEAKKVTSKQKLVDAKQHMSNAADLLKRMNKKLGERGSFSTEKTDENLYAELKPMLQEMLNEVLMAGKDAAEFAKMVVQGLSPKGRPYFAKFVENDMVIDDSLVKEYDEIQSIEKEKANADIERGSDVQDLGTGTDETIPGGRNGDLAGDETPLHNNDVDLLEGQPPEDVQEPDGPGDIGTDGLRSGLQGSGGNGQEQGSGNTEIGRSDDGGTGLVDNGSGRRERDGLGNYHIDDPEKLVGGTPKVRFKRNKKAIETFNKVMNEARNPTAEERDAIAAYIGWGSFGQEMFKGFWGNPIYKEGWQKENDWLRDHLGESAWKSAQASIINAHYTDPPTVTAMWDIVKRLGFKGGRVLEPSMGIGNFYGLMPKDLKVTSELTGIELDETTAEMAKMLYPDTNVQQMGYEKSKTADGFYDLVIGNWPFAAESPADRRYNKHRLTLHDYFFVKALDQVRDGGFVIGITSSGTMDKIGKVARRQMEKRGTLVAAYRMPMGAFKKYAGTSVVADILVFQKHDGKNKAEHHAPWMESVPMKDARGNEVKATDGRVIKVNEYWGHKPENVLGNMTVGHGTTQGREGMIVERKNGYEGVLNALSERIPADIMTKRNKTDNIQYISNNTEERQNSITTTKDGGLYVVRGERLAKLDDAHKYSVKSAKETSKRESQIKALVGIRNKYGQLLDAERGGKSSAENLRKELNRQYQNFVLNHGSINESFALKIFDKANDPLFPAMAALENNTGNKKKPIYKPSLIFKESTQRAKKSIKNPSVSDAFVLARNDSARTVDVDAIAKMANTTPDAVKKELFEKDALFETPAGTFEVKDIYLSGNIREKLSDAEDAQERNGLDMKRNIESLKKVMPADIPYFSIETNLGATWIPANVYQQFIGETANLPPEITKTIKLKPSINGWIVKFDNASSIDSRDETRTLWSTPGAPFTRIVRAAFTGQSITIKARDEHGNDYTDIAASAKANEKVEAFREALQDWIWKDVDRRVSLEKHYNEIMNAWATPEYDGSFLSFDGMMLKMGEEEFNLRKHQVDAIWRGVANGRGLYAHEVGTGKTYTMGGIAIESRRYGLAKKPLILGHNANSASVASDIQEMYPGAKILYIDNLTPKTIDQKLYQIANDDWDAIVLPHSLLSRLTLSRETLDRLAAEEIEALEAEAIASAEEDGFDIAGILDDEDALRKVRGASTAKELVKQRNKIIANIERQAMAASKENAVLFEQLGIDMIIIDEAHEFKKPPISTRMKVKGLNTQTSDKAIALNFLTGYVKELNSGKGVHIFTGTPITNTLNEIYNHMRYTMSDEMEKADVLSWDAWFNTFASVESDVERTTKGDYESVSRLSGFHNVSELRRFAGQYMDIVFADDMPEFVPRETKSGKSLHDKDITEKEKDELLNGRVDTGKVVGRPYKKLLNEVAEMSPEQRNILAEIVERSNSFANASGKERREIMLSGDNRNPVIIETDAAKAGFDPRLYDKDLSDHPDNKINRCVTNVIGHYAEHELASQVIFMEKGYSDTAKRSAGKNDAGEKMTRTVDVFNAAKDLKDKLIAKGILAEEIALVTGKVSKKKRKEIADKVNSGEIRVVVGLTATLGTGVNMQENLRAMHHLDAPWMPGELEQRNGRGHRQGNRWNTVYEYRYITDNIDARRWQVLAKKQKMITDFLKAKDGLRSIQGDAVELGNSDLDDINASFSEAAGDARILIREKLKKDIKKLEKKQRTHDFGIVEAKDKIKDIGKRVLPEYKEKIAAFKSDMDHFASVVNDPYSITINGKKFTKRDKAGVKLEQVSIAAAMKDNKGQFVQGDWDEKKIGEYRGFDIMAERNSFWGVSYYLKRETDHKVKPSIGSIDHNMRSMGKLYESGLVQIEEKERALERFKEVAKEPFGQEATLKVKKEMLSQVEADLSANPDAPPSWLAQGAPIGTEIYYEGEKYEVEGHRKGDVGYYLMIKKGEAREVVSYLDVMDENNLQVYEPLEGDEPVKKSGAIGRGAAGFTQQKFDNADLPGSNKVKFSISSVKPWAENFPNIYGHTSTAALKRHPDYEKAKAGDAKSAARLVSDLIKVDRVKKLGEQFPDAEVVAVHAEEKSGKNAIPGMIADAIGHITGLRVDITIMQSYRAEHTQKGSADRMLSRAEFDGQVKKGLQYIIVDDVVAQGGTISELRHYIENNGGKVVAVSSLSYARGSGTVAIQTSTIGELKKRFSQNEFEKLLQEYNVSGTIESLTEREGKYLLKFKTLDSIRNKFFEEKQEGSPRVLYSLLQRESPDLGSDQSGQVDKPSETLKTKEQHGRNLAARRVASESDKSGSGKTARKKFQSLLGFRDKDGTTKLTYPIDKKSEQLRKIAKAFGKTLHFFISKNPEINRINGLTNPATGTEIFVNINSTDPLISIVGHELIHQLKANHPDLYEFLTYQIEVSDQNFNKYVATLTGSREGSFTSVSDQDVLYEEFIGDFAADQFQRIEFWQRFLNHNRTFTERIIDILQGILDKLKTLFPRAEHLVSNLQESQETLAFVMSEAVRMEKAGNEDVYSWDAKGQTSKQAPMFSTSENMDIPASEKKEAYGQIFSGMKKVFTNRKNKGPNFKEDIGVIENVFGLMSHYSEKIPALAKTFDELLKRPEWKFQKENELAKDGETAMVGILTDLQKENLPAYNELEGYLHNRDIDQIGNLVVSHTETGDVPIEGYENPNQKRTWKVLSEKNEKTGKRKILQSGFKSKTEARKWSIEHEVDNYINIEGREALKAFRTMTANLHDYYAESWEAIIKEYEERGLAVPEVVTETKAGESRINLKVALAQMGERSSYYFPRQRSNGDWKITATKKGEPTIIDYRDYKATADYFAGTLEKQGYTVDTPEKVGSMSEDVYASIRDILGVQAAVNQALAETKMEKKERDLKSEFRLDGKWQGKDYVVQNGGQYEWSSAVLGELGGEEYSHRGITDESWAPGFRFTNAPKDMHEIVSNALFASRGLETDVSFQIAQSLAKQLADQLHSRGSQARMISRSEAVGIDVPQGYKTDPAKAIAQAINSAAGGFAKKQVALNTSKAITGQHFTWAEFQKQHPDYDSLKDIEEEKQGLSENSKADDTRIAKIDQQIKEMQIEAAGVKNESEASKQDRLYRIGALYRERGIIQKWKDPAHVKTLNKQIVRLRGGMHKEYRAFIEDNMIDSKRQKRAHGDAVNAVENVLRNKEASDRVIDTFRGLASVWFLGGRLSSAAINLTSLGTTVPACMSSYGDIPMRQVARLLGVSCKAYSSFATGKGKISDKDRVVLEEINSRGWLAAQLNMETVNALKSGPAKKYSRMVELLMTPFKVTEEFNRGTTLLAAYKGIRQTDTSISHENALLKAKKVSDRAHGIYGIENQPALLRKGRGLNAARSMYIFQTFIHNYFTTLAYMVGNKEAKAATYMLLSPIIFGGAGASVLLVATKMIFKAMGEDDPEEKIYQIAEQLFGETGGDVARYGLPGLTGISLKGSLAPNLPDFDGPMDILGPIGGMGQNIYQGGVNLTRGNYLKGLEKITPSFIGSGIKGVRESTQGITTKSGDPVFFGNKQLKGDLKTGITRGLGFNPIKISKPREVQWNETTLKRQYTERKRKLYNRIIKHFAQPGKDRNASEWQNIIFDIKKFNARVYGNAIDRFVPPITERTIKNRIKRAFRPRKSERLRNTKRKREGVL
jgi:N12 class adenine-specific DNA methylase